MKIGINASFARKAGSGIGQVTINFLQELAKQKTEHEFVLYLEEDMSPHQWQEIFPGQIISEQEKENKNWCGDKPRSFMLPKNFSKNIFLPIWKRDDLIRKIWWEKYLLPRKIKKDKCDMFFSLYQSATVLSEDIKHIMLVHDIIPKLFPEYLNNSRKKKYWGLIEEAIATVDKIIANSRRTEKDLVAHLGIDPAKITASYLDVDEIYKKNVETRHASSVLKKYKLKPGYIYSGGGLEVRKNTVGVIRAYKYLLEANKNLHFIHEMPRLVISGRLLPQLAPLITDVEKLVKELNLTGQVKLLDFVPQENLPALYANATMFVYPSHYEGFGLPILEAMNQGTPVITAKTSSLPEVGGDSVLYCNPDEHRDIAMVMRNILINHRLHATLADRGKERAKDFSWTKFTRKFLNIISTQK